MEEKFVLTEVSVNEDAIGDAAFETRTAGVKGFVAGASLIGAFWIAAGLYKRHKERKTQKVEEVEETKENLVD